MPTEPDFAAVPMGSFVRCRQSPDPEDSDFRGLLLAAPTRVTFNPGRRDPMQDSFEAIPVCGTYVFDVNHLGLQDQLVEHTVLVAVEARTMAVYTSAVAEVTGPPRGSGSLFDVPESIGPAWITGHFNVDLAALLDLPPAEADYHVYAVLGEHASNALHIEVRREPPASPPRERRAVRGPK
ncbi:MAG: hypothetical protein R3B70_40210 [Polyangiaceae bacterium]